MIYERINEGQKRERGRDGEQEREKEIKREKGQEIERGQQRWKDNFSLEGNWKQAGCLREIKPKTKI